MGWREVVSTVGGLFRGSVEQPRTAQPPTASRRLDSGSRLPSQGATLKRTGVGGDPNTIPAARQSSFFTSPIAKVDELEVEVAELRAEVVHLQERAGISVTAKKKDRALRAALSAMEATLQARATLPDTDPQP